MPEYAYKRADGITIRRWEKATDRRLTKCPETGMKLKVIIQPVPSLLNGSGWAKDGYSK